VGSLIVGWPMHKFLMHVLGSGLLLLFARPSFNPALSNKLRSGMSQGELGEICRMVEDRLARERQGRRRRSRRVPVVGVATGPLPSDDEPAPRDTAANGLWGPLGALGDVFNWALGR